MVWLALSAAACSSDDGRLATVDTVEIPAADLDALHPDPDALDEDERAGSALLLVLRQSFVTRAETDLGLTPSTAQVVAALDVQREALEARGDVDEVLAGLNETEARIRINAELDVVRDLVGEHLVRTESGGFDIDEAQLQFLLANAEVCLRQIQFEDADGVDAALARLEGGESFDTVAREVSIDPFVSRDDGGVGAGGDLGCSAPSALPAGLDRAALDVPLGQADGPVASTFGVHIVEVYQRDTPDLDERHDEVIDAAVVAQGPELFRVWAVAVLQDIEVEVDEAFGRWGVLPETDPVPTVVPPHRFDDIVSR